MHDDVSGIDQDPIPLAHSLDADARTASLLDILHEVVGDGADVTLRSAARHDHVIAYGGFSGEIDDDAVLGLQVFQTREDGFEYLLGRRMPGDGFGLTTRCPRECRCAQGFWSFRYVAPAPILTGVCLKIVTSSASFYPGGERTSSPIWACWLCFHACFHVCCGSLLASICAKTRHERRRTFVVRHAMRVMQSKTKVI
jgi:hypothetical protein